MPEVHPASKSQVSSVRVKLTAHTTTISNVVLLAYQNLSDGAKLTYIVLESYDWPDENGNSKGRCWPSIETLAVARGKSYDTIARHLKELEKAGLIRVESGQERGATNQYWLLEPSATEKAFYESQFVKKASETLTRKSEEAQPKALQKYGTHSCKNTALPAAKMLEKEHESHEEPNMKNPTKDMDSNLSRTHAQKQVVIHEKPVKALQSPYLSRLMDDFSRALNDSEHAISNRTQVNNLYQQSGLDERVFTELLYEAKKRTQWAALATGTTAKSGPNRAAYFFSVVKDLMNKRGYPKPTIQTDKSVNSAWSYSNL
ncbi:MAG TPA: helix-turn-helix domain-containing protein [Chloroflexia bacterium]|nr:helix-turn-helix domain-containing protein [Chloroflexia bacterium]